MIPFLIFIVLALIAWLFTKLGGLNQRLDALESRLALQQLELERLKPRTTESVSNAQPPPLTASQPIPKTSVFAKAAAPLPPPVREPLYTPIEPVKQPPTEKSSPRPPRPAINWENFLGVKLFAWIGGLALFLGVAFFLKYSFKNVLI